MKAVQLYVGPRCVNIEDSWYFPAKHTSVKEVRSGIKKAVRMGVICDIPMLPPEFRVGELADRLEHYRYKFKTDPHWFDKLKRGMRRYLNIWTMIRSDRLEPFIISPDVPYSGFGYVVLEDGLIERAVRLFGMFRLGQVAQLGFLTPPVIGNVTAKACAPTSHHSRYGHSADVHAFALLMARNLGLSKNDRDHLRIAAISHDALTPAGGDSTKRINPILFDEDVNYGGLFGKKGWNVFRDEHKLEEPKIQATILGQGKLGRILDLADKLAYTGRDVEAFLQNLPRETPDGLAQEHAAIRELVRTDPLICGLWDSVEIVNDTIAIGDVSRLSRFLKLRALMFRCLYYNPASRFGEDVVAKNVIGFLCDEGILTRSDLLAMTDQRLADCMDKVLKTFGFMTLIGGYHEPKVETFSTLEEAVAREKELVGNNGRMLMTQINVRKSFTSTGVKSFMVKDGGRVASFADVCPDASAEIERIMFLPKPVWLYSFSLEGMKLPRKVTDRLRRERRKRLQSV